MHKKIFILSIPLVISNIAIPFIGVVNTALIGHLHNSSYLAAGALGISLVNLVCFLFAFFRMSMTGLISHSFGEQNFHKSAELILRASILAILLSILVLLSKELIYDAMVFVVNANSEVLELLHGFYNIAIYSVIFALLNYVFLGFFIGVQQTKIVFYSAFIVTIVSIILSILFVNYLGMGVNGVAYSMLIAQAVQTIILSIYTYMFFNKKSISLVVTLLTSKLTNIKSYIPFVKLNTNIFIRSLCLLISFNSFYIFSSYYGVDTLAANSILIEIAVFIAMFLDAIANTTETLVGEAYIRKDKKQLREIISKTLVQCIVITIIFTIIYALTYSYIIDMFTSIESVKIEAHQYIIFSILLPLFAALSFWIDGVFVGMLKTVAMRNAMLLSMISYLSLVLLFSHFANYGLWIAVLCFYIARVIFLAYPLSIYMKEEIY